MLDVSFLSLQADYLAHNGGQYPRIFPLFAFQRKEKVDYMVFFHVSTLCLSLSNVPRRRASAGVARRRVCKADGAGGFAGDEGFGVAVGGGVLHVAAIVRGVIVFAAGGVEVDRVCVR